MHSDSSESNLITPDTLASNNHREEVFNVITQHLHNLNVLKQEVAYPTVFGPANYREYLNESPKRQQLWDVAILKEKSAIQGKDAYDRVREEEVIKQEDAIIIDSRIVLTEKINELMESIFKARLVAKHIKKRFYGNEVFRDENGDPIDTYAPVMSSKTFRLILILAAIRRMILHQFDINNAFLNATYKRKNIYIRPPQRIQLRRTWFPMVPQASIIWYAGCSS